VQPIVSGGSSVGSLATITKSFTGTLGHQPDRNRAKVTLKKRSHLKFSLVIPTCNRKAQLRCCLAGATRQDYPDYEVIVVDDASADGTEEMVRREFSQVRYLRQAVNRGPAAARNHGIEAATGEIVAFTDDDCLVPSHWLGQLLNGYRRYPQVAGVGGYLEPLPEVRGRNVYARYEWFMAQYKGDVLPEEYVGGSETPGGGTSNMSYRRRVLLDVGGFDEAFPFAAGEDADLKKRICDRGYSLVYIPVGVIHLREYTGEGFKNSHITRGRAIACFEQKHLGKRPTYLRIFLRATKRTISLPIDLYRTRDVTLATTKWQAGIYNCYGQWLEVRRLKG
jgi:GT2 family glycosyltransferase